MCLGIPKYSLLLRTTPLLSEFEGIEVTHEATSVFEPPDLASGHESRRGCNKLGIRLHLEIPYARGYHHSSTRERGRCCSAVPSLDDDQIALHSRDLIKGGGKQYEIGQFAQGI